MTTSRRKLHTDRPDFTAALRAAWRYDLTKESFVAKDLLRFVQQARHDLGLAPLQGGAASDQLQRRSSGRALHENSDLPLHYEAATTGLIPTQKARQDWRFLNTPSHAEIRLVAAEGHLTAGDSPVTLTFRTRGSHLPSLTVLCGALAEVRQQAELLHQDKRGLYLLRRGDKNYVGQSREFGTRGRSHGASGADFVFFAFPNEAQRVSLDTLNVAESLAIVGLGEILKLHNSTLGHDAQPLPHELREGAALALAFMAAVTRWAYQSQQANGVLYWRTDMQGLKQAYLTLPISEGQA